MTRIPEVSARGSLMHELNIRYQTSAPDQVGKERNVDAKPYHMRDIHLCKLRKS